MALDTYRELWGKVLLRCPSVGRQLAEDWINNAFRRLAERRQWSWLIRYGQFLAPAVYNTGTVTLTNGSTTVAGGGTTFTSAMVGRQFRIGTATPIYTISQFVSATSLELDAAWGGANQSAVSYEIYRAYFDVPSDFHSLLTVWDPSLNWQLRLDALQEELNNIDSQRANTGQAYVVAYRDYTSVRQGTVFSVVQALGTGPDPVSGGSYTGAADAIFTVEVTTGGITGTAQFRWKKDEGSYTSAVVTSATAQTLQDGVTVRWPAAQTYVLGDLWVVRASPQDTPGVPRYELWPHQKAQYVYPYLYEARATDLEDAGAVLPRYIRGDILLEMALAEAAKWPGASEDGGKNLYFNLDLARIHEAKSERMIQELERADEETYQRMVSYPPYPRQWADSDWMRSHDWPALQGG